MALCVWLVAELHLLDAFDEGFEFAAARGMSELAQDNCMKRDWDLRDSCRPYGANASFGLLTQDCALLVLGYYPLPLRGKRNPPTITRASLDGLEVHSFTPQIWVIDDQERPAGV
jgi:hypothetical protein